MAELNVPIQKMEALNVEKLPRGCMIAKKELPGTRKVKEFMVKTNLFELKLTKGTVLYKYDVQVELDLNRNRHKEISKGGAADDYHKTQNRRRCQEAVFNALVKKQEKVFGSAFSVLYNRWNALYTLKKLNFDKSKSFTVEFVDPETQALKQCTVRLEIGTPEAVAITDYSNEISMNLEERMNCPTTKAVEVLVSQVIFLKPEYFTFYQSHYTMPDHPVDLGSGRVLAKGSSANVKVVEGNGIPHFAVQIDNKYTAFHKEQPVIDAVKEILNISTVPKQLTNIQRVSVNKALRDIVVRTTHIEKDFKISSVAHESSRTHKISTPNGEISVALYFEQKYKKRLEYPDLPCLKHMASGPTENFVRYNYYPMELCTVLPNQRVAVKKQTGNQQQIMIRQAAIPPAQRFEEIKNKAEMLSDSPSLAATGAKLESEPMKVIARKLPLPDIGYKGGPQGKVRPKEIHSMWEPGNKKYLLQGKSKKWAILISDRQMNKDQAMMFAKNWIGECKAQGINILMESLYEMVKEFDETKIDLVFARLSEENVDFVLVVEPEASTIHEQVKLAEHMRCVQTQCVTTCTARLIANGGRKARGILQKVTQKTNMKTRGFNYEVLTDNSEIQKWLKPKTMIIGCDVTHPQSVPTAKLKQRFELTEPSVVGFSFNRFDQPHQYLGEIRYQSGGMENIEEMKVLMQDALKRYAKGHNLPASVIYYRDGVANSQFQKVLEYEVPRIQEACLSIKTGYCPKITVIIVQKRNQARFFPMDMNPKAKSADQNVPIATVVSSGITHPTNREFQLTSHRAPQGTANSPKYIVLLDENQLSNDELEGLTLALCFSHQIINQPISIPEPVSAAHEIAKRGKNLWKACCATDDSSSGVSGDGLSKEKLDWSKWNEKFSLSTSIFKDHKHNA